MGSNRKPRFELFSHAPFVVGGAPAGKVQWYWRLVVGNGKVMSDGSEGYTSLSKVNRALDRYCELLGVTAEVPRIIVKD